MQGVAEALCIEMDSRGLSYEREKPITVTYKGHEIPGQRIDLVVGGVLIVESKVAEMIARSTLDR